MKNAFGVYAAMAAWHKELVSLFKESNSFSSFKSKDIAKARNKNKKKKGNK